MIRIVTTVVAVALGVSTSTPAAAQTRLQLDAANDAKYEQLEHGMVELKRIDSDIIDLRATAEDLRTKPAARLNRIHALQRRYPSFSVTSNATVERVYAALVGARKALADRLRPIAAETRAYSHREECSRLRDVAALRVSASAGDGTAKSLLDFLAQPVSDQPCVAADLLPSEPVTEQSLARMRERYMVSQNRVQRFSELAARP